MADIDKAASSYSSDFDEDKIEALCDGMTNKQATDSTLSVEASEDIIDTLRLSATDIFQDVLHTTIQEVVESTFTRHSEGFHNVLRTAVESTVKRHTDELAKTIAEHTERAINKQTDRLTTAIEKNTAFILCKYRRTDKAE